MKDRHPLIQSSRPPFLVLTPACVFLGLSTAIVHPTPLNYPLVALVGIGALSAHISINLLNEYFDFDSGLDFKTDRTAFSGGSGALPARPDMAHSVLYGGLAALALTVFIGLLLVFSAGTRILPIGVAGILLIMTYTQWINRSPLLCLVAPGTGFGLLMVGGTHLVLTGELDAATLCVAAVPFFLVNNLLLLNQYPDIDADRSIGRRHLPIAYGIATSNVVYGVFALAAYGMVAMLVTLDHIPLWSLLALVPAIATAVAGYGAYRHREHIGLHPQYLACNVGAAVLTPPLLGIGILLG